jgi:hypothetical protein
MKYKIHCITRDSLGNKIAEYDTTIDRESYANLMSIAEQDLSSGLMLAVKDLQIDDELGHREYWLT